MRVPHAKRLAAKHGRELWWDRSTQNWIVQHLPTKEEPNADINKPAEYLSAGALREIDAAVFVQRYLGGD